MSVNFISTNQELRKGDYLVSNNGNSKVVFQEDGNLVVFKWTPVWESRTTGKDPFRLLLQTDSDLVMYNQQDKPVWASGNHNPLNNSDRLRMTITDDAKLTVSSNGKPIWQNGKKIPQE